MALSAVLAAGVARTGKTAEAKRVRLGGPIFEKYKNPEEWIAALKAWGYSAAYCPVGVDASDAVVKEYEQAAAESGITIAEVGAWSNPIDPDPDKAKEAIDKCKRGLELADRIGARCCVNICGSRNPEKWDGPHQDNLTRKTFDLIVTVTQEIIDAVKPERSYFTLETMPWAYPDSTESYQRLVEAIARERFAVHYDPVNLVCSPQRYFRNGAMIKKFFDALGPQVRSCHAKDIILLNDLTTHLNETPPGTGNLDYQTYLRELARFPEAPLMLEHLQSPEEYKAAGGYVRAEGAAIGIEVG
ncbi:MAG: TIM barrel protein [bacterium]|nr:TIM barrel protein [bacterium]